MRSETGWAEFGYFLCYFKMLALRALVFRPLVKGNEDSGNKIESVSIFRAIAHALHLTGFFDNEDKSERLFSLHTIALTTWEATLWEDTRDCQRKGRVRFRIQHRLPPGEVGQAKLLPWLHRTPLNWPQGDWKAQCFMLLARRYRTLELKNLSHYRAKG